MFIISTKIFIDVNLVSSTSSESTSTADGLCASYVDADPETCEQITGIVGCKARFQDCEKTCCRFMSSYENVTSTTVEVTTVDPDDCKDLENLYPNKFCEIVADDSDCEHPSFRKHCQKRCCLLGFEYANGRLVVFCELHGFRTQITNPLVD